MKVSPQFGLDFFFFFFNSAMLTPVSPTPLLSMSKPRGCCSSFPRLEWEMVAQPSPWKSLALMVNT